MIIKEQQQAFTCVVDLPTNKYVSAYHREAGRAAGVAVAVMGQLSGQGFLREFRDHVSS